MKRLFRIIQRTTALLLALTVLLAADPQDARAQLQSWEIDADVEIGYGMKSNVFQSPSELRENGTVIGADSLLRSDAMIPVSWDLDLEREFDRHTLTIDAGQSFRRFNTYSVLSEHEHGVDIEHEMELPESWWSDAELTSEVGVERSVTQGTDVLGDALTRSFASWDYGVSTELDKDFGDLDMEVELEWSLRNYDDAPGLMSLDSRESSVRTTWAYELPTVARDQEVEMSLTHSRRRYPGYTARNAAGEIASGGPDRQFRYWGIAAEYAIELSDALELDVETGYRSRRDPFEGYFDYSRLTLGGDLEWDVRSDLELGVDLKMRNYRFGGKNAPSSGRAAAPTLRYTYLDSELIAAYDVRYGVDLFATWVIDHRYTNVDVLTRGTRRPYRTNQFTLGARFDLDRLYRDAR
jgi:hypothetical protein